MDNLRQRGIPGVTIICKREVSIRNSVSVGYT